MMSVIKQMQARMTCHSSIIDRVSLGRSETMHLQILLVRDCRLMPQITRDLPIGHSGAHVEPRQITCYHLVRSFISGRCFAAGETGELSLPKNQGWRHLVHSEIRQTEGTLAALTAPPENHHYSSRGVNIKLMSRRYETREVSKY
jgi:hypothetical protein